MLESQAESVPTVVPNDLGEKISQLSVYNKIKRGKKKKEYLKTEEALQNSQSVLLENCHPRVGKEEKGGIAESGRARCRVVAGPDLERQSLTRT